MYWTENGVQFYDLYDLEKICQHCKINFTGNDLTSEDCLHCSIKKMFETYQEQASALDRILFICKQLGVSCHSINKR